MHMKRHASPWILIAGAYACLGAMVLMSGCSTTRWTFETSVGRNVTSSLSGAGYQGGFSGPKDVVQFALQAERGRGFCELRHISHLSAGWPVNNKREDFADLLSCGLRIRAGRF